MCNHQHAYISVAKRSLEYLHHVEVRSCAIWLVTKGGMSTSVTYAAGEGLLVPSDSRPVLLLWMDIPVLDCGG